jgi:cell division protein FtsB
MASFAADLSKIVSEKKLTGGAGKAGKKRKLGPKGSAVFGTASSSPCGASSSLGKKVTSPNIVQKTKPVKEDQDGRDRIIEDSVGLLRILETVLVLHEDKGNRRHDLENLKAANLKLEAENMQLENEVVDFRGKKENFVAQARENRELKEGLAKLEEEIKLLKSAMAPAEDETENTRELTTRAEFVARVRKLGDSVLAGVKHGLQNALA